MSKLNKFKQQTRQLNLDEVLAGSDNGYCSNRDLCFQVRLGISEEAIADGWRCAFEEHHQLWQCHLSGRWEKIEA